MNTIDSFKGKHFFLSNFFVAPVEFEGILYPTNEHAFQAAKTLSMSKRQSIANLPNPSLAKRAGRQVTLRHDWEKIKFSIMEQIVRNKFTGNSVLREKLLATEDAVLIEGNDWNDRIWGVCRGQGQNHLGKILMQIRDELR